MKNFLNKLLFSFIWRTKPVVPTEHSLRKGIPPVTAKLWDSNAKF